MDSREQTFWLDRARLLLGGLVALQSVGWIVLPALVLIRGKGNALLVVAVLLALSATSCLLAFGMLSRKRWAMLAFWPWAIPVLLIVGFAATDMGPAGWVAFGVLAFKVALIGHVVARST